MGWDSAPKMTIYWRKMASCSWVCFLTGTRLVVTVTENLLPESSGHCTQPHLSRALSKQCSQEAEETLAFRWTGSIIILSWRKELFPQDVGFRWDTAAFPKGWCAILGQVKGTEHCVAPWSPHLPSLLMWLLVQSVSPEIAPRAQRHTEAMEKAGSDGKPAAWPSAKGQRVCWKCSVAFHASISTKRWQSWAPRGITAVQRPITARLTALWALQPLEMITNI